MLRFDATHTENRSVETGVCSTTNAPFACFTMAPPRPTKYISPSGLPLTALKRIAAGISIADHFVPSKWNAADGPTAHTSFPLVPHTETSPATPSNPDSRLHTSPLRRKTTAFFVESRPTAQISLGPDPHIASSFSTAGADSLC